MNEETRKDYAFTAIVTAVISVCMLACMLLCYLRETRKPQETTIVTDTVRVTVVDTLTYIMPIKKEEVCVRYVTRYLPAVSDSVVHDTVLVEVPISRSVYEDSTYRAVVSGYNASLDTIMVFPRMETVTIMKEVTTRQKPKRFGVGIQAGYGIGTRDLKPTPYVGIGIHYDIFNF